MQATQAKQTCKTCGNGAPTYKGVMCLLRERRVKTCDTCRKWRPKE